MMGITPKNLTKATFLNQWVKDHRDGWNHDDWLGLLSQLDEQGFTYKADDVGSYIEKRRRKVFGW